MNCDNNSVLPWHSVPHGLCLRLLFMSWSVIRQLVAALQHGTCDSVV